MIKHNRKILIVDDDVEQLDAIKYLLEKEGYQIYLASDENDAIDLVHSIIPDLVILDVNLHNYSGIDLCRKIKAENDFKNILVILISATSIETEQRAEGLEAGAEAYISRPVSNRELLAYVASLLKIKEILEVTREQFKLTIDSNPAILWTANPDGFIDYYSDKWYQYSGLNFEDGWSRAIHPEDLDFCTTKWTEAFTTGSNFEIEFRIKRFDGEYRWFLGKALPQYEEQKIIKWFGSTIDINENKVNQQILSKQKNDLKSSNDDLNNFALMVSHDLQYPLRTISSYLELIKKRYKDKLDENANEYIEFAVDGAKRMSRLLSALLSYSKVGKKNIKFLEIDLNQSVEIVLNDLQHVIYESSTKVTYDKLPIVKGDNIQIIQVLQNLISNAVKYNRNIEPKIHISAIKENGHWIICVADNGIGISEKDFERIFSIFQRLHTESEYPGLGVGLSICKKIIEIHKGKIWLESEENIGTRFYFTLPDLDLDL